MKKVERLRILDGAVYRYTKELPLGCGGELYEVVRMILDVPSYQWKVLCRALTGRDRGLWFSCTPSNFAERYEYVCASVEALNPQNAKLEQPRAEGDSLQQKNREGRVADFTSRGKF